VNLKKKTLSGLFWVGLEKVGLHLIQFVVFIILARLLTPEDFGLVGMIMILFSLSSTMMEGGIKQALIREKKLISGDLNTAFTLNLLLGIFLYIILFFSAPYVSTFYGDNRLTLLVRIMGLAILFKSLGLVHSASLIQSLNFKRELILILPAYLLSGLLAVTMAFYGFGVISLAVKFVTIELINSFLLFFLSRYNVRLGFNRKSFKKLMKFGIHLSVSKFITSINSDIHKVVIGKFFSASNLGLYTQAQKVKRLLSSNIVGTIQKVTYPVLSKIGGGSARLKEGYRKIIMMSCVITIPLMVILIITADPLIPFLLGEQWIGAVPMLQIIAVGGMIYNITLIHQNLLKVLNMTDTYLKLEIIQVFNFLIGLLIGIWFDILTLISLMVLVRYVNTIFYGYSVGKFIDYTFMEQIKDISDVLVVSFLILGITYIIKLKIIQLDLHDLILIITLSVVVLLLFVGIGFIIKSEKIKLVKGFFNVQ
jgi:O-antigen/teichoic acid export membrane protein